jgi:hypothetical protein
MPLGLAVLSVVVAVVVVVGILGCLIDKSAGNEESK